MAAQNRPSRADRLLAQWTDFRRAGSIMYDVLLWQDLAWPALSLAWLPQANSCWQQPAAVAAAEQAARQRRQKDYAAATAAAAEAMHGQQHAAADRLVGAGTTAQDMDVDGPRQQPAAAAAAAGASRQQAQHQQHRPHSQKQQQQQQQTLLAMPVDYHYLLTGAQTSGREAAYLDLYRVELPGLLPAGGQQQQPSAQQQQQPVLMQKGDMQLIMRIPHGNLDVNRITVMPSQPNIICTSCDAPEVYLFDLRQHTVQLWQPDVNGVNGQEKAEEDAAGDGEDSDVAAGGDSSGNGSGSSNAGDSEGEDDGLEAANGDASAGCAQPPHPQAVLTGRSAGGFGLEFNPVRPGLLLGGDVEGGVQLWDVTAAAAAGSTANGNGSSSSAAPRIPCLQEAPHFAPCAINDVSWHRHGSAYALCTELGQVWVQDMRAPATSSSPSSPTANRSRSSQLQHGLGGFTGAGARQPAQAQVHVRRHRKQRQQPQHGEELQAMDCFCVAFDPLHDHRLASGGADGFINILDMRKLDKEPVDKLGMHAGSVTSLAWSHSLPGLLCSSGEDGAVLLWDANKLQHAAAFTAQQQPQQQPQQHQQQRHNQQGLGLATPRELRRNLTQEVRNMALPGLLFMHGGHFGPVGGLALNPDRPWLMASSTECVVEGPSAAGRRIVVQRQPVMVWEVNRSQGLLC